MPDSARWGGVEFSGSGRYLYVCDLFHVFQFDMEADDIGSTKQIVKTRVFPPLDTVIYSYFKMTRGPDCRIYISNTNNGSNTISLINFPERVGVDCEVIDGRIVVDNDPYGWFIAMPQYPNYRLDTEYPTCDSSIALPEMTVSTYGPVLSWPIVEMFPNPAQDVFSIKAVLPNQGKTMKLQVHTITGQPMYNQDLTLNDGAYRHSTAIYTWPSGLYIASLQNENGLVLYRNILNVVH